MRGDRRDGSVRAIRGTRSLACLVLALLLVAWLISGCSRGGADAPETVEIKDVVTNLADPTHYVRLSVVLECEGTGGKKVAKEETKVRDAVVGVLRRHSVEDMRGDLRPLRKELVAAINKAVGGDYVKAVYFEEFITQ